MSKRSFRDPPPVTEGNPCYPTLESFDRSSRRSFLAELSALGAALLGAGALAACDHRAVATTADGGPGLEPSKPQPPNPPQRDFGISGGASFPSDAEIDKRDRGPLKPDLSVLEGDVAGPDARIDDLGASPGFAPMMDARVDGCEVPDPKPTP